MKREDGYTDTLKKFVMVKFKFASRHGYLQGTSGYDQTGYQQGVEQEPSPDTQRLKFFVDFLKVLASIKQVMRDNSATKSKTFVENVWF